MKTPVILLVLAVFITTWSTATWAGAGNNFDELEKDFSESRSSSYLESHFDKTSPTPAVETPNLVSKENEEFEKTRFQLLTRKSNEENLLEEAILKNGLFTPPQALWEKVHQFKSVSEFERLLNQTYSLESVFTVLLANSREIKTAFEAARASLEKYSQVTNLDEILSQYAAFTKGLDIKIGKPLHNKSVNMNFPFPGMLALKGEIVKQETLAARFNLHQTAQDMLTQTNKLYQNIIFQEEAIQITNETLELLKRLKDVVDTMYSTGRSNLNDVMKIQMEVDKLETDLVDKNAQKKALQVKLNKVLNLSYEFSPKISATMKSRFLDYKKDNLINDGLKNRIEIKVLKTSLARMNLMIAMAEKRFFPDPTPGYSFFQNRIIKQTGSEAPSPTFGNRPMIRGANWFGMNDAYIRETKIKLKAMEEKLEGLKNQTVDAIYNAVYRYERADRDRKLFKNDLVPKSQITIETTEALYSTGKVDFLDLIDSEQRNLKYKLNLEKAVRDLNIEALNLARFVGSRISETTKESHQIDNRRITQ